MKMQNVLVTMMMSVAGLATAQAASRSDVAAAQKFSGTFQEDPAQRQEWNQAIDWGTLITFSATPGRAGGTYKMVFDDGTQPEVGQWTLSCSPNGKTCSVELPTRTNEGLSYDTATDTLLFTGSYDESSSVFRRITAGSTAGLLNLSKVFGRTLSTSWHQQEGDEGPIAFSKITLYGDGTFTALSYDDSVANEKPLSGTFTQGVEAVTQPNGTVKHFPYLKFQVNGEATPEQMTATLSADGRSLTLDDSNAYYESPRYK